MIYFLKSPTDQLFLQFCLFYGTHYYEILSRNIKECLEKSKTFISEKKLTLTIK